MRMSLEEIFLQVTTEEAPPSLAAAPPEGPGSPATDAPAGGVM